MEFEPVEPGLVPAARAAATVGRSDTSIRRAIHRGHLGARKGPDGHWYVRMTDVKRWHEQIPPRPPVSRGACAAVAEALTKYPGRGPVQLGEILGRHPGNVRKALVQLAAAGWAHQDEAGAWWPDHALGASAELSLHPCKAELKRLPATESL